MSAIEMSKWEIEQAGFGSAGGYISGQAGLAGVAGLADDLVRYGLPGVRVAEAAAVPASRVAPAASNVSKVASALGVAWRDPGFAGSFIRLATVVGGIVIVYEGATYFFDAKRTEKLNNLIQDPSIPEDLKRQAIEQYIRGLSAPASLLEQFGTLVLIGGGAVAGLLVLNWYLKRPRGGNI